MISTQVVLSCEQNARSVTTTFSSSCPETVIVAPVSSSCPGPGPLPHTITFSSSHPVVPISSSCPKAILFSPMPLLYRERQQKSAAQTSPSPRRNTHITSIELESPIRVELDPAGSGATLWHAFSDEEIEFFAQKHDCHAIVSHGAPLGDHGLLVDHVATEHAPVFVHPDNEIETLCSSDLLAILRGDLTCWEEFGFDARGPIRIYLHGGALQRRKFAVVAGSVGVSAQELAGTRPRYLPDYVSLEKACAEDSNCLVLGLKAPAIGKLKLLSVDGVFPLSPDSSAYKLSLPIFLLHRGSPVARNFRKQLTRRLSDNRAIFDAQIKGVSSELH